MRIEFTLGFFLVAAACSTTGAGYTPILDGPVTQTYQSDLSACRQLALQSQTGSEEIGVAIAAGALFGGFVTEHEEPDLLPWGVALGALAGWVGMVADQDIERQGIVVACMQGRGHRVVG